MHCLKKKLINNAGLDVFEKKPIDQKHAFLKMKHGFYSAHNAFNTIESVERTNEKVIENLIKGLK